MLTERQQLKDTPQLPAARADRRAPRAALPAPLRGARPLPQRSPPAPPGPVGTDHLIERGDQDAQRGEHRAEGAELHIVVRVEEDAERDGHLRDGEASWGGGVGSARPRPRASPAPPTPPALTRVSLMRSGKLLP